MKKEDIQPILDFVEGKISANQFKDIFQKNSTLQEVLKEKLDKKYQNLERYNFNLYTLFMKDYKYKTDNWDNINTRYGLMFQLTRFLTIHQIQFVKYSKYEEEYLFFLDIQPSWLDLVDDQGIFDQILSEIPQELSKAKQIAWGKARIKELFRYDKTYPRWVQGAEWPIVDGKPLVFSHQSKEKKEDERVYYYFYNPDTEEQIIIEQMY